MYSTAGTQTGKNILYQAFQYPMNFLEVHKDLIHPGPTHCFTYESDFILVGYDRCDFIYKHREVGSGWGSVLIVPSSEPIVHPKERA
jgi:hypothetical protein